MPQIIVRTRILKTLIKLSRSEGFVLVYRENYDIGDDYYVPLKNEKFLLCILKINSL